MPSINDQTPQTILAAFVAPFPLPEVRFLPQAVHGNRALAIAYITARAVMDRLDQVVGVDGWHDAYEILPDHLVVCRLRVRVAGEWIEKADVGNTSEQPDDGDRLKAAFSDALKRAAVKFGIGRYLYRIPQQWVDYDPAKKQFTARPTLPAWALPGGQPAKEATPPTDNSPPPEKRPPANGRELLDRIRALDASLSLKGKIAPGALLKHVVEAGGRAGLPPDILEWEGKAMQFAATETKRFLYRLPTDEEEKARDFADAARDRKGGSP